VQSSLPVLWTRPGSRGRATFSASTTYLVVFAVGALLLLTGVTRIYLEHRTTGLERNWLKKKEELAAALKERENLMIERERYLSGEHILKLAVAMGLRPPLPGQVRKMSGAAPAKSSEDAALAEKNR
jgi:hypothetical protein